MSDLKEYEIGGHFIISGSDRKIVHQERPYFFDCDYNCTPEGDLQRMGRQRIDVLRHCIKHDMMFCAKPLCYNKIKKMTKSGFCDECITK